MNPLLFWVMRALTEALQPASTERPDKLIDALLFAHSKLGLVLRHRRAEHHCERGESDLIFRFSPIQRISKGG